MSTQTPTTAGTHVESFETNTEFQLVTTVDPCTECAGPDCHCSPEQTSDELSLILGAEIDGMAADYGTVEFCSLECARSFLTHGRLTELDTLHATGSEIIICPGTPVAAHVHLGDYPEPVHSALDHDVETALDAASTWLIDEADTLAAVDYDDADAIEDYSISIEHL